MSIVGPISVMMMLMCRFTSDGLISAGLGHGFHQFQSTPFIAMSHRMHCQWVRLVFLTYDRSQFTSETRRKPVASEELVSQ